jgi:hypothetical protein
MFCQAQGNKGKACLSVEKINFYFAQQIAQKVTALKFWMALGTNCTVCHARSIVMAGQLFIFLLAPVDFEAVTCSLYYCCMSVHLPAYCVHCYIHNEFGYKTL